MAPHLYGRGPSIDDWAAQLLRDIDGPLVAVGASMGGYCALALARRAPERIVGWPSSARGRMPTRSSGGASGRSRSRTCGAGKLPALAEPDTPVEHLVETQEAMRDRLDLTGVVASFGGPLLVCVGDRRTSSSRWTRRRELADRALDGRLEVFEGAGHFVAIDQPERFNAVLLEFVGQWP